MLPHQISKIAQELLNVTTPPKYNKREASRAVQSAIQAEYDAIKQYESIGDAYPPIKERMQHIADEEKVHVGELLEVLKTLDEDSETYIDEGRKEVSGVEKQGSKPTIDRLLR